MPTRPTVRPSNPPAPAFQRIKDYVQDQIAAGVWREGDAIPPELRLAETFAVSRMTVNRALNELEAEQILVRRKGAGTFVAQQRYQATVVEIRSIAEEIRARGHRHRSSLYRLERQRATRALAAQFGVAERSTLFHSVIVHFENDAPIQVEDRWVNPALAPDYMEADFGAITPNEHLMRVAPLQRAEYQIEALLPTADVAEMLAIAQTEPALVLRRRTFSQGAVASVVVLWHPGSRYRFGGALGQAL
ncbi:MULTISPECIES: histidine utilization repressor [unclassified Cupriavidus]|uniref:histidine utilization repressor n=1 Tax=unclassified Cupriavidus TaxID=2640874 RepID=UPI0028BBBDEC|nr:histidine utilization repressor [Cupriavidus sp. SZY C1]MDT6961396.1 histidine utilization repressor [Cupriavidus sp. SZY C1]